MKRLIVCLLFALAAPAVVNAQSFNSGANHTYYASDTTPSQLSAGTIQVFCGSGTITAAADIRIMIPTGIDLAFDPGASVSVAMSGTAPIAGGVAATVTYASETSAGSGLFKHMIINVTTTFDTNDFCTVTGARYAIVDTDGTPGITPATTNLTMDHTGDTTPEETDFFVIRIAGNGTISSAAQLFYVGQTAQSISAITLTDHASHPGFTTGRGIRIRIPSSGPGLDMTWQTSDTAAVVTPGAGAGTVSSTVAYDGTGKVLRITVTNNFDAGQTLTVSGLQFQSFNSVSGPDQLELVINGSDSGPAAATDANDKQIRGNPNLNSGNTAAAGTAPLRFTVSDPVTTLSTVRVTDALGVATITTANDIRIRIPATFSMEWATTTPTLTVQGAAASKMSGTFVSGTTTMVNGVDFTATTSEITLLVVTNFAAGDVITINGLQVQNFGTLVGTTPTGEAPDNLELFTTGGVSADDDDDQTVAIGAPTMLSASNQVFNTGDTSTPIADITITDGGGGIPARIGAAGTEIRIRIPAGFDMEWDTSDTSARILGSGNGHIGGNISGNQFAVTYATFDGASKILIISVTSAFSAGESITIDQLSFRGLAPGPTPPAGTFVTAELPDNLELIVNNTAGTVCEFDDSTIAVGGQPSIAAAGNMKYAVRDPATALQQNVVIADALGVPRIDNSTECRVRIASFFDMEWNTADASIQITASATTAAKITGAVLVSGSTYNVPVTYENNGAFLNRVMIIGIATDFSPGETFTILGASLSFAFPSAGGAEAAQADVLELVVNGSPTSTPAADTDDANTIAIGQAAIACASQVFGIGDAATPASAITITDDAANPIVDDVKDLRVRIPAAVAGSMQWNTSDTSALFTGTAAAKITGATATGNPGEFSAPVSFEGANVLVIPVATDFAAGEEITVNGLSFAAFTLPESGPSALELVVSGAPGNTQHDTDGTVRVNTRPTITAPPPPGGVRTEDSNNNGVIDRIVIVFSEDMQNGTATVATGVGFAVAGFTVSVGNELPAGTVTFILVESGTPNTGATPLVSYDPSVPGSDLTDTQGLELLAVSVAAVDRARPRIIAVSVSDTNGNGRPNTITLTYSEILGGGADLADWQLIDANGTNLIPHVTGLTIVGSTLVFTLDDTVGTTGVPRYLYTPNGVTDIADAAGNTSLGQSNNSAPVANAGPDFSSPPTRVTLNGGGSLDPDGQAIAFSWSVLSQPAGAGIVLSGAATAAPTFIATVDGPYVLQLQVSDGLASSTDTVTVTVVNVAPNAHAGFDQTVNQGATVALDATRSVDVNGDTMSFLWSQLSGPPATLSSATSATPTFGTAAMNGTLVFEVAVSDGALAGTDTVIVRVNAPGNAVPTANAGPDIVATVGSTVTLNGLLSFDPDGDALSYAWSPASGLTGATTATPTFTPVVAGAFTFTLTVTETTAPNAASAPDSVTVLVINTSNLPPLAAASKLSPAGTPAVNALVTLDSAGSSDPEEGALFYTWVQVAGPFAALSSPTAAQPTFTPLVAATYVFRLTVSDGAQNSLPATVEVAVTPGPAPVAIAALDATDDPDGDLRVSTAANPIALVGTGSTGAAFFWTQTAGPAVVIASPTSVTTSFSPAAAGVYTFTLTAFDAAGASDTTALTMVVDVAGGNQAPTANAGPDVAGIAGQAIGLDGTASFDPADTDLVTGFSNGLMAFWYQVSGPAATLSDPGAPAPSVMPTVAGTYVFALVVSDGTSDSAPDLVTITVSGTTGGGGGSGSGGGCGLTGMEPVVLLLAVLLARRRSLTGFLGRP